MFRQRVDELLLLNTIKTIDRRGRRAGAGAVVVNQAMYTGDLLVKAAEEVMSNDVLDDF